MAKHPFLSSLAQSMTSSPSSRAPQVCTNIPSTYKFPAYFSGFRSGGVCQLLQWVGTQYLLCNIQKFDTTSSWVSVQTADDVVPSAVQQLLQASGFHINQVKYRSEPRSIIRNVRFRKRLHKVLHQCSTILHRLHHLPPTISCQTAPRKNYWT